MEKFVRQCMQSQFLSFSLPFRQERAKMAIPKTNVRPTASQHLNIIQKTVTNTGCFFRKRLREF